MKNTIKYEPIWEVVFFTVLGFNEWKYYKIWHYTYTYTSIYTYIHRSENTGNTLCIRPCLGSNGTRASSVEEAAASSSRRSPHAASPASAWAEGLSSVHFEWWRSVQRALTDGDLIFGALFFSASWFQPGLISQPIVFSSHNKLALAGLISPETNQRTGRLIRLLGPEILVMPSRIYDDIGFYAWWPNLIIARILPLFLKKNWILNLDQMISYLHAWYLLIALRC